MACNLALAHEAHRGKTRPAGCTVACRREYAVNHHWQAAKGEALERSGLVCARCGLPTLAPDVHHIVETPHGYRPGCAHHQSNLEVLCTERDCHVAEHSFRRRVERVLAASGREYVCVQMELPLAS